LTAKTTLPTRHDAGHEGAMPPRPVFMTGASGFVGSHVLAAIKGHPVHALVRSVKTRLPGGVEPVPGDVTELESLTGVVPAGAVVLHLVGIIVESEGQTFDTVIRRGTENLLASAIASGASHFVFISAIGARDDTTLPYLHAKYHAEEAVRASGMPYTIIRPSIVFGEGDGFVNTLAGLVRSFPVIPVAGDGESRFQPVAIGDLAAACAAIIDDPPMFANRTLEFGGSDTFSYNDIIGLIRQELDSRKPVVHLPVGLVRTVVKLSAPLPPLLRPPVTNDQLNMLRIDNTTSTGDLESVLGRRPLSLQGNLAYLRHS